MTESLHIFLLGSVQMTCDGKTVPLRNRRQRVLIAMLASYRGKVITADRLIAAQSSGPPPMSARTRLHASVADVRSAVSRMSCCQPGPGGESWGHKAWPILTVSSGYLMHADGTWTDLDEYRSYASAASAEEGTGELSAAVKFFEMALSLWRGPAYANARTPAVDGMAVALDLGRLQLVEQKAECELRLGQQRKVTEELTAVIADEPFREDTRCLLMLALYRCGCRAQALEVYRAGQRMLREYHGIDPGPRLRGLHEKILADDWRLLDRDWLPGHLVER